MLSELKDSNYEWQDYSNKDSLLESSLGGNRASLTSLLKLLVFHGEARTPYMRDIYPAFNHSVMRDEEDRAIRFVHDTIINPFTPTNPIELNVPSIEGHVDYDSNGVMYIKSPQMTYKTESLKELVDKIPKSWGVILIGHRKTLLAKTCKDLGLKLYEDLTKNRLDFEYTELKTTSRLGITWHSIYKIGSGRFKEVYFPLFNVVIFDESDQVFKDFYTSELGRASKTFTDGILKSLVSHSDLTVCLDADISNITKRAMEDYMCPLGQETFYVNKFPVFKGYEFTYLHSRARLWERMVDFLKQGEILYITCEHKGKIESVKYDNCINLHWSLQNQGFQGIALHEETTSTYKEVFENPNKHIPELIAGTSPLCKKYGIDKLQYLITSPTLETGWSCGTPGEEHSFTKTFGIFPGYPNVIYTVHSIRQAVRRARCVSEHFLFVGQQPGKPRDIGSIIEYLDKKGDWLKWQNTQRKVDYQKGMAYVEEEGFEGRWLNGIQQEEFCRMGRFLHSRLLFEEYGGDVDDDVEKGEMERPILKAEERLQLKRERITDIIEATEITPTEREEIHYLNTERNKVLKAKYDVRKTWHHWGEYKDDTDDRPYLSFQDVKRWRNGDIRKCYNLRDIAYRLPEQRNLIDGKKAIPDSKWHSENGHLMDIFFKTLGVNHNEVFQEPNDVMLFNWNIPDDTVEYLTQPSVIEAMNWVGNFGYNNTTEQDALTFFNRVAVALDFNVKLYQPYDPDLKEMLINNFGIPRTTVDTDGKKIETDVSRWLFLKCMEWCKSHKMFKGVYEKMKQRKITVDHLHQLYHSDYDLLPRFVGIKKWGTPFLRYTNRHLIIKTYETYPIGILSELTQFDIRGDSHRSSFGLNRRISEIDSELIDESGQVEQEREGIYDL